MRCPACGTDNPDDARICGLCRAKLGGPTVQQPAPWHLDARAGVASSVYYASFPRRLVAHLVDSLLVSIVVFALIALCGMVLVPAVGADLGMLTLAESEFLLEEDGAPPAPGAWYVPALVLILVTIIAIPWLYAAVLESGTRHATLGKQLLGLQVRRMDGGHLSFGQASIRYVAKLISEVLPFAAGCLLAFLNPRRQALHDMIAGTVVIQS